MILVDSLLDVADAVDCFETLMKTLGLPWSIYIPAGDETKPEDTSKLNDCKAAVAFIS